jgi:hypothetical protein
MLPFTSYSQVMDVDVSEYCKDQMELLHDLDCDSIPKIVIDKKDEIGNKWKVRFHFGFSKTEYYKTDLNIQTERFNVVVKDIEMQERTSVEHYNPKRWNTLKEASMWIDEPTNTFAFSLEKGKNIFYLTVFHPKYLKSIAYKESVVNGENNYEFKNLQDNSSSAEAISNSVPLQDGFKRIYFQNTHHNAIWQIGYGRQFQILDSKFGKLSYVAKADIGGNSGMARSVDDGKLWPDVDRIQGYNASIGHRLELQKGKVSLFIDHKVIYSNIETGFLDGKIDYDLVSSPLTFGVGIDIFTKKRKNK